jgi:hypothetical protein
MRTTNRGRRAAVSPPSVLATKGYKRPFSLRFLLYLFTMQSYRSQPPTCAKLPTYISPRNMFFGRPPTAINLTISAVQSLPAPPRPTHLLPQVRSTYRYLHREQPQRHHERSFLRISVFNVGVVLAACRIISSVVRNQVPLRGYAHSSGQGAPRKFRPASNEVPLGGGPGGSQRVRAPRGPPEADYATRWKALPEEDREVVTPPPCFVEFVADLNLGS